MLIKKLTVFNFVIISAFVLVLQACGGDTTELADMAPTKISVQVLPFISYGPLYIAEAEGYFTDQNLEVEFVPTRAAADAIPLVIQGVMDIFTGAVTAGYINAVAAGENLRVVADRGFVDPDGCTYLALLAGNEVLDSGRLDGSAEELQGLQITREEGSFEAVMLDLVFADIGFSYKEARVLDLSYPEKFPGLVDGSLDVTMNTEPGITLTIQSGEANVWKTGEEVMPGYQLGVLAYGPSLLEDNPDAGRRFMVAYMKGLKQFSEGKTERNLEIMVEATQLDEQLLKDACWPSFRADGYALFSGFSLFQDWALGEGLLDALITEDQYFDSSFVDYANGELD